MSASPVISPFFSSAGESPVIAAGESAARPRHVHRDTQPAEQPDTRRLARARRPPERQPQHQSTATIASATKKTVVTAEE